MAQKEDFDYSAARQELDEIIDWFEAGSPELDEAIEKYKRAKQLLARLEEYLDDVDRELAISINSATQ